MRMPIFFTKVRQFVIGSRYCAVTVALLSASFLCALAQEGHALPSATNDPLKSGWMTQRPSVFAHTIGWSSRLSSGWTSSGDLLAALPGKRGTHATARYQ